MTTSAFAPATLGPITLRNRIIKAATFEGATPRGEVTDALIDYHLAVGRGGAGMSTVAYLAVAPEGRTDRHAILLDERRAEDLARLTAAVHETGALVQAQIGHAGPVANARSNKAKSLGPSNGFSPMGSRITAASPADLRRIVEAFGFAARNAVHAGFDAIEVHLGHNYLPSAFLSPKLNKRSDAYGGSLENRARFDREILVAVREAAGSSVAVTAKLNMVDGVPGGTDLADSLGAAKFFEKDGTIDALCLTGGSSLANPMFLFRGPAPRASFAATLPQPIRLGFNVVGGRFFKDYPFEEGYFLPLARQFKDELSIPIIALGGITTRSTIDAAIEEGFGFVAMARALLREPDLVNQMAAGRAEPSVCTHCNECMTTIYSGTRCVEITPAR